MILIAILYCLYLAPPFSIAFFVLFFPAWFMCYVDYKHFGGMELNKRLRDRMFKYSAIFSAPIALLSVLQVRINFLVIWVPIHLIWVYVLSISPTWAKHKGFTRDDYTNTGHVDMAAKICTAPIEEAGATIILAFFLWVSAIVLQ